MLVNERIIHQEERLNGCRGRRALSRRRRRTGSVEYREERVLALPLHHEINAAHRPIVNRVERLVLREAPRLGIGEGMRCLGHRAVERVIPRAVGPALYLSQARGLQNHERFSQDAGLRETISNHVLSVAPV